MQFMMAWLAGVLELLVPVQRSSAESRRADIKARPRHSDTRSDV